MLSPLALLPTLAPAILAASTPTTTTISFAWAGQASAPSLAPTASISATILAIHSHLTTLAFTCPPTTYPNLAAKVNAYYNNSIGALCPLLSDAPQTLTFGPNTLIQPLVRTYGDGYYGKLKTFDGDKVAHGTYACAITAAPVPGGTPGAASATADPACVFDLTAFDEGLVAEDVVPEMRCMQQDVVGDVMKVVQNEWDVAAYNSCLASMSASPTTRVAVPRRAEDVHYWTVTVTGVAEGATLEPASSGASGVTAQSTSLSAGAKSVGVGSTVAFVIVILVAVIAL